MRRPGRVSPAATTDHYTPTDGGAVAEAADDVVALAAEGEAAERSPMPSARLSAPPDRRAPVYQGEPGSHPAGGDREACRGAQKA